MKFPDSEPLWFLSTDPPAAELAEAARREPGAMRPPEIITLLRRAIPQLDGKLASGDTDFQLLVDVLNVLRVTRPATPNRHALGRERIRRVTDSLDVLAAELPRMVHQARQNLARFTKTGQPCTIDGAGLVALTQLMADLPAAKATFVAAKRNSRSADWHKDALLLAWHLDGICSIRGIEAVSLGDKGPIARIVSDALARVGAGEHSVEAVSRALRRAAANPPTPRILLGIEPDR